MPVRLPLAFWPHLFESLWTGSMAASCWTRGQNLKTRSPQLTIIYYDIR